MLCLRFSIDGNSYGLDSSAIVEVIPKMPLRETPGLPHYIPGCFKYRGHIVPVIDINMLCGGKPTSDFFSSRIAVLRYSEAHLIGLLLENATETAVVDPATLEDEGFENKTDPFFGKISVSGNDMLQLVNVEKLLPEEVRGLIFHETGGGT